MRKVPSISGYDDHDGPKIVFEEKGLLCSTSGDAYAETSNCHFKIIVTNVSK
jgi:hypothetical protein